MNLRFTTLDVFTDRPFGGNPLAVFCDQPEIPTEQMLTIARELNLSETVFIVPPRDARARRRLRIFAPGKEMLSLATRLWAPHMRSWKRASQR